MTEKEYNICVDLFADNVYRFLLKHIRCSDYAKDIMQDSFLKLWERREEIGFEKSKSYVFTIAYHNMIDQFRKIEISKKEVSHDREIKNTYSDAKEILNSALETLPSIQKSAILLRDYEGYSYAEISEILNISLKKVKVYIFRARKTLKEYIVSIDNIID